MLVRTSFNSVLCLSRQASISIQRFHISTGVPIDFKSLQEHRSIVVEKYGDPHDSVTLKSRRPEEVLPKELGPKQVLVEHLAACINPADINLIQGVYGKRPELPAVVGNEGVTRVKSVGSDVTNLKPGDIAIGISMLGYWQSYSVQPADDLYKIDSNLNIEVATQLKVNPCTAYRMIKDFAYLKPGDTIIQNGANSAVGVYVIQLAKLWGLKTINIIRDRPNKEEIVKELRDYGADFVLTEEEIANVETSLPVLKQVGKPKLFLNCVGGKNAISCQKTLDQGGYSVTYGAMSRQPFSVSATSLIFKNHKYVGFWVSRWYLERQQSSRGHEISAMLEEIGNFFKHGKMKPKSSTVINFEDRNIAFGGSNNTKYMFSINKR